jgi:hypothetical protein
MSSPVQKRDEKMELNENSSDSRPVFFFDIDNCVCVYPENATDTTWLS